MLGAITFEGSIGNLILSPCEGYFGVYRKELRPLIFCIENVKGNKGIRSIPLDQYCLWNFSFVEHDRLVFNDLQGSLFIYDLATKELISKISSLGIKSMHYIDRYNLLVMTNSKELGVFNIVNQTLSSKLNLENFKIKLSEKANKKESKMKTKHSSVQINNHISNNRGTRLLRKLGKSLQYSVITTKYPEKGVLGITVNFGKHYLTGKKRDFYYFVCYSEDPLQQGVLKISPIQNQRIYFYKDPVYFKFLPAVLSNVSMLSKSSNSGKKSYSDFDNDTTKLKIDFNVICPKKMLDGQVKVEELLVKSKVVDTGRLSLHSSAVTSKVFYFERQTSWFLSLVLGEWTFWDNQD
jgi:hypothetical protein